MRTPPTTAPTKFNISGRVLEVETVAASALTEAKRAHARLDAQPPRGEQGVHGLQGPQGRSGDAGRDGRDGKDGLNATGIQGPQGRPGADGAPGKDAPRREELETLLTEQRRELKALHAEIDTLKNDIVLLNAAIFKQEGYRDFLAKKVAARIAAKQQ